MPDSRRLKPSSDPNIAYYRDLVIKHEEQIKFLEREMELLKADNKLLLGDRSKVIGISAGLSGVVGILVKYFWPHGG